MIRSILFILFAVTYLILGIPVLGILWILRKFNRKSIDLVTLRMVQWALSVLEHIAGVEVIVTGYENVPTDEAVLYVGNHRSYFDIVTSYSRCPGLTGYISKDSLQKIPLLRTWMERVYCLFLNRDDTRQGLKTILAAIDQVKHGISIFVFPEGTRSKTGEMAAFHEGTFKIATKTGCPIVPVAFSNTEEIFENHMPFLRKTKVVISYGKPILPSEIPEEYKKRPGAYVQGIVAEMKEKGDELLISPSCRP